MTQQRQDKMRLIEIDESLYHYIASQTEAIGESASSILRRLLHLTSNQSSKAPTQIARTLPELKAVENKTAVAPKLMQKEVAPSAQFSAKKNTRMAAQAPIAAENTNNADKKSEAAPLTNVNDLIQLVNSREFIAERKSVNRFLTLLEALYQFDHNLFALAASSLHGSKRIYLAKDKKILMSSGSNTKPKLIAESPYWVVTNNNSQRKGLIVGNIMEQMGFEKGVVEFVKHQFLRNKL